MIEIKNLTLNLNNAEVLKKISATINQGEIVGIIGKSGSGKTILLKVIAGLLKGYSGDVLLHNMPLESYSIKNLAGNISCLLKKTSDDLIDDTLFNFLILSRKPTKKFLNPYTEFDIQITDQYIKLFQLEKYRDEKILSLSDGLLKRALLAYSFIREAGITILDNPTSDLDPPSILLLHNALQKYVINGDKIVIIASNDINFITQTVDRILIFKCGNLVTEGTPDIIDAELIKKFFDTDVLISRNIYNGKPNINLLPGA